MYSPANGGTLTGNPLCVFEERRSRSIPRRCRRWRVSSISRKRRSSCPPARANAQVRIFTPSYEMPFAGHPTLGTAHVCRALGLGGDDLKLEMQAGIIPVRSRRRPLDAAGECTDLARVRSIARHAGEDARARPRATSAREPLWVKAGKEQLVIPLTSERAVRNMRPDAANVRRRAERGRPRAWRTSSPSSRSRAALLSRFFFPVGSAILEDPATGSATANFGGWMIATGRKLPVPFRDLAGRICRPSVDAAAGCGQRAAGFS